MVGTILPIVYGARDSKGGKLCLWLHGIGCGFGGIVLGCAVGVFGWIIPDALRGTSEIMVAAIGGAIHLVAAAHDLRLCQMPVPVSRWQVPQKWSRTMPLSTVSLAYGVLLGFGVLTRIPASTFVVVLLWVAYLGSAPVGALVLGVYGVSRALPVTALSFGGFSSGETVVIAYKLAAWQPVMHMLNGLILAFATGWLVGGSVF